MNEGKMKQILYAASRQHSADGTANFCETAIFAAMDEAVRQALHEYGQHKEDCKTRTTHDPEDCDCGFLLIY